MTRLAGLLAVILTLGGVAAAAAQTPPLTQAEQGYLSARDAAIAAIKARIDAKASDVDISATDDKALADLETRLRAIVGPVSVAGFGDAKINLETLQQELGFGYLDGLVVRSPDSTSSIVVTTEALFAAWLRGHKDFWKGTPMPQTIAAAVRAEAFYTQGLSTDAAMVSYGELPVKKPAGASFAFAILGARTQDQSPPAPDQIFVTVVKGGRVFVANAPLKLAMKPPASCAALRASFKKRADALRATYQSGGMKDEKLTSRADALEQEGDEKQRLCVGEKMSADQRAQATRQTDAFIDTMTK